MKLRGVQITNFRSIWNSNFFEVGKQTCLVGKNEAGKTAILQALYRLNPIVEGDGEFNVTDDYPRSEVEDYRQDIEARRREPAEVIRATFAVEPGELSAIEARFGAGVLAVPEVVVAKGYAKDQHGKCIRTIEMQTVESIFVKHLVAESVGLPDDVRNEALSQSTLSELAEYLARRAHSDTQAGALASAEAAKISDDAEKAAALEKAKTLGVSEPAKALQQRLKSLLAKSVRDHIWDDILADRFPKFLYFDEYYTMLGRDNVEALRDRKQKGALNPSDHPLLGLIELARLDLASLLAPERTQDLKNQLQGASNHLTKQVLRYWSQNRHLRMAFDVRPARPKDPPGMQTGTNIWGEVEDTKHLASTGLGTRSAGFVWFFSFLAWYSAEKKKDRPLVLLLDEPGLSLHGRAQEDLLRYFEAEVVSNGKHQLIYTTHSPFMVDAQHFERVRIVQDKGIDSDVDLPREEDGTKVFTDVLEAGPDSLFPLQGALGYGIHQTLFVGPNSLVVEGVSDLLCIQTVSAALEKAGRTALNPKWTITPVGGSDKVPTFVALLGAQSRLGSDRGLRIATLIDFQKADQQWIENIYRKKLLARNRVLTYADFTGTPEADVEDMFDADFYLGLVSEEFSCELKPGDLKSRHPRMVVRLEEYFATNPLPKGGKFNHYRPARLLVEKAATAAIPHGTLDRFEAAFKALNALLS